MEENSCNLESITALTRTSSRGIHGSTGLHMYLQVNISTRLDWMDLGRLGGTHQMINVHMRTRGHGRSSQCNQWLHSALQSLCSLAGERSSALSRSALAIVRMMSRMASNIRSFVKRTGGLAGDASPA